MKQKGVWDDIFNGIFRWFAELLLRGVGVVVLIAFFVIILVVMFK